MKPLAEEDPPEFLELLLLAALIPIFSTLGAIAANEVNKLAKRGWRLW